MKGVLLDIRDKVKIPGRCCPPHHLPHVFPWEKPICGESCHYHKSTLRMLHHVAFCYILGCSGSALMVRIWVKSQTSR